VAGTVINAVISSNAIIAPCLSASFNGTTPPLQAGDMSASRSADTGVIVFGTAASAGVGGNNYWYWDGTNMNLGVGGMLANNVQATWNGSPGTPTTQVVAGDVLCARSATTGVILFGIGVAGLGASNYWYWTGTTMNLGFGALNVNGQTGVSAGPFTSVTGIRTYGGIVTTLSGTSDERLKDAELYEGGLGAILAINPVRYRWNAKGQAQTGLSGDQEFVGFIAQDVQRAIPEAITATEPSKDGTETYLSLDDRPIICALVNAIKELNARIVALEAKLGV
jgi:hypothetical protein